MKTSEQINEIAAAMAQAQSELRPAVKDAENPAYRSKYADLASVWDACHEVFPKNGIAILQELADHERGVSVNTRLAHASGQWIEFGPFTVPLARQDAHGVGSAASYAKRYALSAAVGVVAEDDDDGNAAASGAPKKVKAGRQPGEAPAEYAARKPETAPDETSDVHLTFGSAKGMSVRDTPSKDLAWYRGALSENVVDPKKAKWREGNQRLLDAVVAELERREQTDDAPFAPSNPDAVLQVGGPELLLPLPINPDDTPTEAARAFYLKAISKACNKYDLTTGERLAIRHDFLKDMPNDTAEIKLVHALYLVLGDEQAIKDWRAQRAVGSS